MKVVVAPDTFGGTLTAGEAADLIKAGWLRARPNDELVTMPLADGGEGTIDVIAAVVGGAAIRTVIVPDALGTPIEARWLQLADGRALIESAQACGLSAIPLAERDPRRTTTEGVGHLIAEAVRSGANEVVVGIGGTATVDGGSGLAAALGYGLLRRDGSQVAPGGSAFGSWNRSSPILPLELPRWPPATST
jgi:glycerate kinase